MKISELKKDAKVRLTGIYPRLFGMYLVYSIYTLATSFLLTQLEEAFGTSLAYLLATLVVFLIDVPLIYGTAITTLGAIRNEDFNIFSFISRGFKNFGKIWKTTLRLIVRLAIPMIIVIVTYMLFIIFLTLFMLNNFQGEIVGLPEGIDFSSIPTVTVAQLLVFGLLALAAMVYFFIKNLNYATLNFVLADNNNLTAKEVLNKTKELMTGYKLKYVGLNLSFIFYYIAIIFAFLFTFIYNPFSGIIVLYTLFALLNPYIVGSQICLYEDSRENNNVA